MNNEHNFNWPKFFEGFGNGLSEGADDAVEIVEKVVKSASKLLPCSSIAGADQLIENSQKLLD